MQDIHLTIEEFANLKKIGAGKDGTVYSYKNGLLIKVYHQLIENFQNCNPEIDNQDQDMKFYQKGTSFPIQNTKVFLHYETISNDKTEILNVYPREAIKLAIQKQPYVSTSLPLGNFYLQNQFAGSVLKKQYGIQIHKLTGLLSLKQRKIITLKIVNLIAELLKQNIYHCDLANSPFEINPQTGEYGHSHILIRLKGLTPQLIDLDGTSTLYTDFFDEDAYRDCIWGLNHLIMDFLLQMNTENFRFDYEAIGKEVEQLNISDKYIDTLSKFEMPLDQIKEFTLSLNKSNLD